MAWTITREHDLPNFRLSVLGLVGLLAPVALTRAGSNRLVQPMNRCVIFLLVLTAWSWPARFCLGAGGSVEVRIDASRSTGTIRPLHGVNSGPINCGGTLDLSTYHRQLAIPLTRLHDCHWPNPDVVDIHVIFPDFRADPSRPESYDFAPTDEYIQAILDTGSGIVYRLGESIEHTRLKRHVHPPPDPMKWAAICVGIIRHYNEGWVQGFRHKIRYWEIWNEPENRPAMWTGTDEDFFRLYSTAAKTIKTRFPEVRVGGPAVGDTGRLEGDRLTPSPFLRRFLEHCRRDATPLDFFSWHLYTSDPVAVARRARAVRRLLDESGFRKTESHLNEWNYLPGDDWEPMLARDGLRRQRWHEDIGGPAGAAFSAAVLLLLQDTPLDVANYYAADHQGFGLFNGYGVPKKSFHAFRAFRGLLDTPLRLPIQDHLPEGLAACAGRNAQNTEIRVLLSQFRPLDRKVSLKVSRLPWKAPTHFELFALDSDHDLSLVQSGRCSPDGQLDLELRGLSVCLVKLRSLF